MTPLPLDWDCLGPPPAHPATLQYLETCYRTGKTEIYLSRCLTCAQLYRVETYEISDWSGGSDYYDETKIWIPLDEDEAEAVRRDSIYRPRSDRSHRYDSGWRAG